jgi:hypothetical protein
MLSFTSPAALFQAALDAVNAEDWLGAARLCDPGSLRAWHGTTRESWARRRSLDDLTYELPGTASIDELEVMPPEQCFARSLHGSSLRGELQRLADAGMLDKPLEWYVARRTIFSCEVLGVLHDGDRVARVAYRHRTGPGKIPRSAIQQSLALESAIGGSQTSTCLRQADGTWLLATDYNFVGMHSFLNLDLFADGSP